MHPQLQALLLRHFASVAKPSEKHASVQVIASSHSPILVSQAPLDSVVALQENDAKITATSICSINIPGEMKNKLQRFLDATRSELFFARRLIMVEGISEALLLPIFAKLAGGDLKESAVTILNADGLNFNAFLPLFGKGRLEFPVAILTDGDAKNTDSPKSNTLKSLKEVANDIPNLDIFHSEITFEHELALTESLLPSVLDAFEALHSQTGKALKSKINGMSQINEKADAFYEAFVKSRESKGIFAQELVSTLENKKGTINIPPYIRDALKFLGVIS